MPPIPLPKGQRLPPFDGPPTAVSCGGEAWEDPAYFARLIKRYSDVFEQVVRLSRWSIEVLGIRSELDRRYQMLIDVARRMRHEDLMSLELGHIAACERCERLEDEILSDGVPPPDNIAISIEAGWVGSYDDKTPVVVREVRAEMLRLYLTVRNRNWLKAPEDRQLAYDIGEQVRELTEKLFSITSADEYHWSDWIASLADAGRVIRDQALTKCGIARA